LRSSPAHVALIVLLGIAAYSNTLTAPFTFDTVLNITENPAIRDVANIPALFTGSEGIFASRPLMHATFAMNYYLGGLDTAGYHALNIAIHIVNGILLYLLILATGKHMGLKRGELAPAAAFSALLFTLHPVQTEAVTDVVNRSMLLSAMFYFSGMILFLRTVTAQKRKGLYAAALLLVSLLGMSSRENFATFPVMLVLYDLCFISKFRPREAARHWWAYVPVLLSLLYMARIILGHTYDTGTEFAGAGVPHQDYFFTQFNVHWTYLRLLVMPLGQNLDYDYPIARTLFEWPTLPAFAGYVGLLIAGIAFAKRRPALAFPVLWFLVILTPISFGVTLMDLRIDDVIFEHRLYLPGAALFAIPGAALYLLQRRPRLGRAGLAIAVALPLVLGASAYARNSLWRTGIGIWGDAAAKSPLKARPQNNLGVAYDDAGQSSEAIEAYLRAIENDPGYIESYNNLCSTYQKLGEVDRAIKYCQAATSMGAGYAKAHFNLGNAYRAKGLTDKAIEQYEAAAGLGLPEAHTNLGIIYKNRGLLDKAIEHHRQAIRLRPEKALAYMNLANTYSAKGAYDDAVANFNTAIRLEPDFMEAHFNLGNTYQKTGRLDEAIAQYLIAIKLSPNFAQAHSNLAEAYRQKGLPERAAEHERIAERLGNSIR
jgi:tetratricopeptide (TPR) repeat protein